MTRRRADPRQWVVWLSVIILVGLAMLTARERLDKAHVTLALLLVVLWGSASGGRALGISLASVAFLIFDWFFLPPFNTLVVADPLDWLVLIAFLITGVTAAQLFERQRQQAELAERRADEIERIATLGAENLNAPRATDALDAIAAVIRDAMGTDACAIFLRQENDELRLAGRAPHDVRAESESSLLSYTIDHAESVAERADGTLTLIGDAIRIRRTDEAMPPPLSDLRALGIPLSVRDRVVGALRLSSHASFSLSEDQRRVLAALSYYAALGAERVRLAEAEERTESLRRADRLKDALLTAVSHDLRTPLTAIKGIANEIWRGGDPLRAVTIEEEADRLNAMVSDLLELSQLNAGVLPLAVTMNTVDDVVGAAIERIESAHGAGRIAVHIANDDAILVGAFDFMHTVRALTNLLENALKYSPPDAAVRLDVVQIADHLRFSVEDTGPGVAAGDQEMIFEPFRRGSDVPDGVRGTGLGLAIARQLMEAQCGTLSYESRVGGGSRFTIELPAASPPPL